MLKVLVIGSGGREHAIVWKLLQSENVEKVFCLPGNAGMEGPRCERVPVNIKDPAALRWIENAKPDLVVIGPEAPLADGLADALRETGLKVFGPGRCVPLDRNAKVRVMMPTGRSPRRRWQFCRRCSAASTRWR